MRVRLLALALVLVPACVGGTQEFTHDCAQDCATVHMHLVRVRLQRLSTGSGIVCICEPGESDSR